MRIWWKKPGRLRDFKRGVESFYFKEMINHDENEVFLIHRVDDGKRIVWYYFDTYTERHEWPDEICNAVERAYQDYISELFEEEVLSE